MSAAHSTPFIVGIGGTTRAGSSGEKALRHVLANIEKLGGRCEVFSGPDLLLPTYSVEKSERTPMATRIIDALRQCDGVVIASPGYHGSYSGLIKNVLDYAEDLAKDPLPYLQGRAVGCIANAFGWQAIGTTLVAIRSVVHALKAWPTPMGVSINSSVKVFNERGEVLVPEVARELDELAGQMIEFARMRQLYLQHYPATPVA